jgi:hypothetical protein
MENIVSIWIGIASAFIGVGVTFGALKADVKNLNEKYSNAHDSIGKLFSAVNDSGTVIAELKGKLESIETTLNRLCNKMDGFHLAKVYTSQSNGVLLPSDFYLQQNDSIGGTYLFTLNF